MADKRKGSGELSGFSALHYACASRKLDAVLKCLELGVEVNSADIYGETALHLAAQSGNLQIIKALVEHKAFLDVQNQSQCSPLHIACQHGYRDVIKFLVEQGANTSLHNKKGQNVFELCKDDDCRQMVLNALEIAGASTSNSDDGLTPLMLACVRGDIIGVSRLASEHPETLNAKSTTGDSALHLACQVGSVDIARILLEHKADVSLVNARGKTAFDEAALIGRRDLVADLTGASPAVSECACAEAAKEYDSGSKMAFTPLHYASANNNVPIVRELLNSGASVSPKNIYNDTPLHYAARNASAEIVRLLLAHKAEVNAESDAGDSPVMLAVRRGNREIVSLLAAAGADLDLQNKKGVSPRAIMEEHGIVIGDVSLNLNEKNGHGSGSASAFSPLMYASVKGDLDTVKRLVADGSGSVKDVNAYGDSALCYASLGKSAALVAFLIEAKSDVNLVNSFGESPIHMAAAHAGGDEIVKLLIAAGADGNRKNKKGKTPRELAKSPLVKALIFECP